MDQLHDIVDRISANTKNSKPPERSDSAPIDAKDVPKKISCCSRLFCRSQVIGWNAKDIHLRLRNSRKDRAAYVIDRILSKRWRFFLALLALGLCQVCIGGFVYAIVWRYDPVSDGGEDRKPEDETNRLSESIWHAWTFMADPGTHAGRFETDQRVVSALITLLGILFFASILGVTVDMVREKMDSLRQGKSRIIEKDHTLILGWTEKTVHIIEELCSANASEGGGVVAVLAPFDKAQMELELELQLPSRQRRGTRVVFRHGSPLVLSDLIRVSVHMARAIIILSSTGNADSADSDTLRTMLSLRSLVDNLHGHVVAEVRDIDNEPLVKLVGGSVVETLVSHDVIGRLMLMSVRQPGLAKVYEALLGFEGDEFYFAPWPELEGVTFGDLPERFPAAIPIGIRTPQGATVLKPPMDHTILDGDEIIVIAEDNDTYQPEPPIELEFGFPPPPDNKPPQKERILFCGWRRDIRDILVQLDKIVKQGTEVHMMTHCIPIKDRADKLAEDGLAVGDLKRLKLVHWFGNTSVRRKLEKLPMEFFTSAMIFADQAFEADTLRADSHSLATLLLIRDLQAQKMNQQETGEVAADISPAARLIRTLTDLNPSQRCPIICEVLDPHTQRTIACNRHLSLTSDFCQTNKLIAQVLAMIAEERTVNLLFAELLGSSGCDVAVVPHTRYCTPKEQISYLGVSKRAQHLGELVVGYQLQNSVDSTVLNPPDKTRACIWDTYDFAILRGESKPRTSLAEDASMPLEGRLSGQGSTALGDFARVFAEQEKRAAVREDLRDKKHADLESSVNQEDVLQPVLPTAAFGATGASGRIASKDTARVTNKSASRGSAANGSGGDVRNLFDDLAAACIQLTKSGNCGQMIQVRGAVDALGVAVDHLRQTLTPEGESYETTRFKAAAKSDGHYEDGNGMRYNRSMVLGNAMNALSSASPPPSPIPSEEPPRPPPPNSDFTI